MAASVEAMLDLWSAALREGKARLRPLFKHPGVAASAAAFLDGLLGPGRRKTGWMRAEAAGDPGPWRQQAVLGRSAWDAEALRDVVRDYVVRDYVVETLASPAAVLVIDETGFLKRGKASCGVARRYTGSAGKTTNCQIGVFAAYASEHGHAFIDRRLYLPKRWSCSLSPCSRRYGAAPTTCRPQKLSRGGAAALVRWSVQDIRRVATRLAQRQIEPAPVIAWSAWRRAHQAAAQEAHIRRRAQL
jgi:DDE superfamily endonuclease